VKLKKLSFKIIAKPSGFAGNADFCPHYSGKGGRGSRVPGGFAITCSVFFLFAFIFAAGIGFGQHDAPNVLREGITVPEGTVIPIMLTDYLNTRNSQAGDVFYAETVYPIWVQQTLIIPKGSNIRGTVTEVVRPGRIRGKGRLTVRFDDVLLPNGVRHTLIAAFRGIHTPGDETIDRRSESVEGSGSTGEDVETVIGTTTSGAILGTVIGAGSGNAGKGAAIGTAAGAAAGIAQVLFSRGRDLVINPGARFDLELKQPMKFALNELEFSDAQLDRAERDARRTPSAGAPKPPVFGSPGGRSRPGRGGIPGGWF
jgi:type IV secretion system protein VirB10